MARITIVGDGPAGLSAALFLAKNGHAAQVFGRDRTPMHFARLFNYLGIEDEPGPAFQQRARAQVQQHGAHFRDAEVVRVERKGGGFRAMLSSGEAISSDYVVLAAGKQGSELARALGLEVGPAGVPVDREYRTEIDRVYAVGRLARPDRSQAIISAGAGATAALDVLARENGTAVTDWDGLDD